MLTYHPKDSSSLGQCLSASFEFTSNLAVPPFFMLSFAHGGESTIDYLGTDPLDLEWTVRHNVSQYLCTSSRSVVDIYSCFTFREQALLLRHRFGG